MSQLLALWLVALVLVVGSFTAGRYQAKVHGSRVLRPLTRLLSWASAVFGSILLIPVFMIVVKSWPVNTMVVILYILLATTFFVVHGQLQTVLGSRRE